MLLARAKDHLAHLCSRDIQDLHWPRGHVPLPSKCAYILGAQLLWVSSQPVYIDSSWASDTTRSPKCKSKLSQAPSLTGGWPAPSEHLGEAFRPSLPGFSILKSRPCILLYRQQNCSYGSETNVCPSGSGAMNCLLAVLPPGIKSLWFKWSLF